MRIRIMAWGVVGFALPLAVEAQRGGIGGVRGAGGLGLNDTVPPPAWADSLDSALRQQKPVLLYVCPTLEGEDDLPGAFRNPEVSRLSRDAAVFVRLPYKATDPVIQERKIAGAPCLLGLDWHGNEWHRTAGVSQGAVKEFVRLIPEEVQRYEEALTRLLAQAKAREEKEDVRGALVAYKKIAQEKRVGFEAIPAARERLKTLGEKAIADALALAADPAKEKEGIQTLTGISRDLDGTPVGSLARLVLLKHKIEEARDLRSRVPEIQKLARMTGEGYDEVVEGAKSLLELIDGYGQARIEDALRKSSRGLAAEAKAQLKQIQSDFPGLKSADRAKEELAKL